MKKLNKKGFTIVELVIVISVIAILSAVMIPTFTSVVKNAKTSAAIQDARNAYTEYIAKNPENTDANMIYTHDNGFVVVKDGALYIANGEDEVKVFAKLEDAQAVFNYAADADGEGEGTAATHEIETNGNWSIYTENN